MGLFEKAQQNALKQAIPDIKKAILEELEQDDKFREQMLRILGIEERATENAFIKNG